jgi:hypothetical protein
MSRRGTTWHRRPVRQGRRLVASRAPKSSACWRGGNAGQTAGCGVGGVGVALLDVSTACLSLQQRRCHVGVHGASWLWLLRGDGVDGGVGDLASPPVRGAPGAARRLQFPLWRRLQSCACAGAEAHGDLVECVRVHDFRSVDDLLLNRRQ